MHLSGIINKVMDAHLDDNKNYFVDHDIFRFMINICGSNNRNLTYDG